ncbi:TlpA family protein disulfide reductase [Micromonospora fluostatini]|uniref:TlpA family protein disulfide reductase n=1 Tax=Micromonospora fluostatini TaxID=1629071 RepID=A0ABY2DF33_9ACTN|nr:TlpA family protein disulfide reductase [Micromonospora fluostatini]
MNRRLAALLLPVLLLVAGCTTEPGPGPVPTAQGDTRPSPFADCAALTSVPPSAGPDTPAPADSAGPLVGQRLPDLVLPCFTGGDNVALAEVRGPAVVNVWASWCPPCREELPAFQRLAERADGRFQVIGINSRDRRTGAQSIGEDFGVRFPMLYDQGDSVQSAVERNAIPMTLFVGADGRIRHLDVSGALDDASLADLVRRHLGVRVTA